MRRSSSTTRSYLHRLSEPVPRHTALLTTPRSAYRGQSVHESIPPILDSISDPIPVPQTPRHADPQTILIRRAQAAPSQALPRNASAQPSHSSAAVAGDTPIAAQRGQQTAFAPIASDKVRPHPINETRESTAAQSEALPFENNASLESEDHKPTFTQTPSTTKHIASAVSSQIEPIPIARDRRSRIHIGTVEVRTAAPVREPHPAPAIDRSSRPGRAALAAEPLARPLAWSHGLVQG